ncbi:hypothetical protein V6N12_057239 [Hibiscus sabdariffa]|uniref:Uncharacterized protein n=1 Tax=Hibiscus sabdariffa TaxID=183260 RepID=A0ABR2DBB8_9ROSI
MRKGRWRDALVIGDCRFQHRNPTKTGLRRTKWWQRLVESRQQGLNQHPKMLEISTSYRGVLTVQATMIGYSSHEDQGKGTSFEGNGMGFEENGYGQAR